MGQGRWSVKFPKLFGRKEEPPQQQAAAISQTECPHVVLAPRWDSVQDIGHEDRAVGYRCIECGASLTREAAAEARRRHLITP